MCLIVFAYKQHPQYELILIANRDEFLERPTATAHWWEDHPEVLGGRDLQAGGTWMGVNKQGDFAALTNFREPHNIRPDAPSRGALVKDFLTDPIKAKDYMTALEKGKMDYNGFNLLVKDNSGLYYSSNRKTGIQRLEPGIYGLSNHLLDTPWPKVKQAKKNLENQLELSHANLLDFITVLSETKIFPDSLLPKTGVPLEWERILSAMYILSPKYGTRATTVFLQDNNSQISFYEQSRIPRKESEFIFQVDEQTLST